MRNFNTLRGLGSADFFVCCFERWVMWILGVLLWVVVNLGKLVSSVLLKFLNLTNLFTPPPKSNHNPLPLAGIKNNTRDYWGVGVWLWMR